MLEWQDRMVEMRLNGILADVTLAEDLRWACRVHYSDGRRTVTRAFVAGTVEAAVALAFDAVREEMAAPV